MIHTIENDDILSPLTREVATHLGEGWAAQAATEDLGYRVVVIQGPDGARVRIGLDWRNAGRVVVSGEYPGDLARSFEEYGLERHEIRVSRARGAQVIAREITRRLMPAYLPDLEKAQERVLRDFQNLAARQRLTERVRELLPAHSSHEKDGALFLTIPGVARGSVRFATNGAVGRLDVYDVPADVLLRLVATLTKPA
jgi:hypothetical protein